MPETGLIRGASLTKEKLLNKSNRSSRKSEWKGGRANTVLYSRAYNLVFAHYPKTGGSSIRTWFHETFADDLIDHEPDIPHHHVRKGLARLRCGPRPPSSPLLRLLCQCSKPMNSPYRVPHDVRVLGVLREPFDLLRSLFLYWRRTASPGTKSPFIRSAVTADFTKFVWLATARRRLPNYHRFFGVGTKVWQRTTLVDFSNLKAGLQDAMRRLAVPTAVQLPSVNANPAHRHTPASRGELLTFDTRMGMAVRQHFAWYYDEGRSLCLRGSC